MTGPRIGQPGGNEDHQAATPVERSFAIAASTQTIDGLKVLVRRATAYDLVRVTARLAATHCP